MRRASFFFYLDSADDVQSCMVFFVVLLRAVGWRLDSGKCLVLFDFSFSFSFSSSLRFCSRERDGRVVGF